jgi:tripartite-type tricarboxylate transporter receptor subunit TctC
MTAAAAAAQLRTAESSQDYPSKSVRLVVPSAPGGGTDIVARLIAQGLTESWGQTVVVDNRGGAGGIPAVAMVAKNTAPDGYTMLLGSVGHLSFAPALRKDLGFDPERDLAPVSLVASQAFVVATQPTFHAKTMRELIAAAKAGPGSISYGSGGSGSASHLGTALLELMGGFKLLHIPYKGTGPGMAALMSNEVQVLVVGVAAVMPQVRGGRIRALAVTGANRSPAAPDIPTVAESGVPGYAFDVWYGVMFPGETPRPIISRTHAALLRVLQSPALVERYAAGGIDVVSNTPQQFAAMIKREIPVWHTVVKQAKIHVE